MPFKQDRKPGTKLDPYAALTKKGLIINPNREIHKEYRVPERRSNSTNAKGQPTFRFDGSKADFVKTGMRKKHIANKIHQAVHSSIAPAVAIFIKKNLDAQI
jgi:hypothetical protein|tara:strand:- start:586 stop:891 length:306 start_codon:yes stop_codon:yes gene_type:complete